MKDINEILITEVNLSLDQPLLDLFCLHYLVMVHVCNYWHLLKVFAIGAHVHLAIVLSCSNVSEDVTAGIAIKVVAIGVLEGEAVSGLVCLRGRAKCCQPAGHFSAEAIIRIFLIGRSILSRLCRSETVANLLAAISAPSRSGPLF